MDIRPFCANGCKVRLRCERNDVYVRYGNEDQPARPGDSILAGDLWKCPSCGTLIIRGWAEQPWRPHEYPQAADHIFALALAIDASPDGYAYHESGVDYRGIGRLARECLEKQEASA